MKTETSVKSKDEKIKMPPVIKSIWMVFGMVFNLVQGIRNFIALRFGWALLHLAFCLIYFFIVQGAYLNAKQKLQQSRLQKEFRVQTVNEHLQNNTR